MKIKPRVILSKSSPIVRRRVLKSDSNDIKVMNNSPASITKKFFKNYKPLTNLTPPELTLENFAQSLITNQASYDVTTGVDENGIEFGIDSGTGSGSSNPEPSQPTQPTQPTPVVIKRDFAIASFQIPEFKLGTCVLNIPISVGPIRWTVTIPGISGRILGQSFSIGPWTYHPTLPEYRKNISINYPCVLYRMSELQLYVTVTYPNIQNGIDVAQIVHDLLEKSKDAAMQELLLYLPFATITGGASIAAALTQAVNAFRTSLTQNIRNISENFSIAVTGPGTRTISKRNFTKLL